MTSVDLRLGDSIAVLPTLDATSVDAVVTDPPYGLEFMGRAWDDAVPGVDIWAECLRVLKPGGHLLAFGGTRTVHRLACAIEDAGFEIRDQITWLYGSGFPKSLDVSKAIDKTRDDYPAVRAVVEFIRTALDVSGKTRADMEDALGGVAVAAHFLKPSRSNAGCPQWDQWLILKDLLGFGDEMDAEVWRLNGRKGTPGEAWEQREVIGYTQGRSSPLHEGGQSVGQPDPLTAPATPDAERWSGWGTALKPAQEPIIVARKPLTGTVAATVLAHGTGALNVDGTRVNPGAPVRDGGGWAAHKVERSEGWDRPYANGAEKTQAHAAGRWPANVLLSHGACDDSSCEPGCPVAELDAQSGNLRSGSESKSKRKGDTAFGTGQSIAYGDEGGASRFFPSFRYQAKAPASERPKIDGKGWPTVKPLSLMRWLVKLVTPPGGLVLDPFAGTGATLQAAELEGFRALGIERDEFAYQLAHHRLGSTEAMAGDRLASPASPLTLDLPA